MCSARLHNVCVCRIHSILCVFVCHMCVYWPVCANAVWDVMCVKVCLMLSCVCECRVSVCELSTKWKMHCSYVTVWACRMYVFVCPIHWSTKELQNHKSFVPPSPSFSLRIILLLPLIETDNAVTMVTRSVQTLSKTTSHDFDNQWKKIC